MNIPDCETIELIENKEDTYSFKDAPVALPEETPLNKINPFSGKKIDAPITLFIAGVHLAALAGFFTFSWQAFLLMVVLHWITGGLGITLCYHRLLTHRSFKASKFVEYILSVIGCLACQGSPMSWVAAHRHHHAKSDQKGDPHSPLQGFFWAHMGWCLVFNEEISSRAARQRLCPDLAADPFHRFLDKTHFLWTVLLAGLLYAWGGWPFVVWGIFVRMVLVYHCTWLVNSAAHIWGYRTYATSDQSTNLWWVALMTYGEGWHNNHHAFQYSARHGLKWWEIDTTYLMIQFLSTFGLVSLVKIPSQQTLTRTPAPSRAPLS